MYTIAHSSFIATGYGLDGPGIESRWSEIFRSRPGPLIFVLIDHVASQISRFCTQRLEYILYLCSSLDRHICVIVAGSQ